MVITEYFPTDRSKIWTKRDILADKDRISLYAVTTATYTHDTTRQLIEFENMVILRSQPRTTKR